LVIENDIQNVKKTNKVYKNESNNSVRHFMKEKFIFQSSWHAFDVGATTIKATTMERRRHLSLLFNVYADLLKI